MDFAPDATTTQWAQRVQDFLDECVYPAEPAYAQQADGTWDRPPVMDVLRAEARRRESRGAFGLRRAH